MRRSTPPGIGVCNPEEGDVQDDEDAAQDDDGHGEQGQAEEDGAFTGLVGRAVLVWCFLEGSDSLFIGEGTTYIPRRVFLHLNKPPNRLDRHADRSAHDASAENGVHCSTRQVVLQHATIACSRSVRRHCETPGRKTRAEHDEQEQRVSHDGDATWLADREPVGGRMR